ncbi:hypothetical protein Trydic_g12472 [Trypoxylus dichotomus]
MVRKDTLHVALEGSEAKSSPFLNDKKIKRRRDGGVGKGGERWGLHSVYFAAVGSVKRPGVDEVLHGKFVVGNCMKSYGIQGVLLDIALSWKHHIHELTKKLA